MVDVIDYIYIALGVIGSLTVVTIVRLIVFPLKTSTVIKYFHQQKFRQAMALANKLIHKNPSNYAARYFLGKCHIILNDEKKAEEEFNHVNRIGLFSLDCPEIEFREAYAKLLVKANDLTGALKQYLLLSRINHKADYFFEAGKIFQASGNLSKAIESYLKTIQMDDAHEEAYLRLGILYYKASKQAQALKFFQRVLYLNQHNSAASFWFGVIFKEKKDYKSALEYFAPALRNPDYKITAMIERGECLLALNKVHEAQPELERALRLVNRENMGDCMNVRYFLARTLEEEKKYPEALTLYKEIYDLLPEFRDVAAKIKQYDLKEQVQHRADDRIKDYITASNSEFNLLCKKLLNLLDLNPKELKEIYGGIQVIAEGSGAGKWGGNSQQPILVWFLRIAEFVTESNVRLVQEKMKEHNIPQALIFSSAPFTPTAIQFASSRTIELFYPQQIQKMLEPAAG